jgi:hypothetical protein
MKDYNKWIVIGGLILLSIVVFWAVTHDKAVITYTAPKPVTVDCAKVWALTRAQYDKCYPNIDGGSTN